MASPFFKLEIYAPEESVDEILNVLAQARAGWTFGSREDGLSHGRGSVADGTGVGNDG